MFHLFCVLWGKLFQSSFLKVGDQVFVPLGLIFCLACLMHFTFWMWCLSASRMVSIVFAVLRGLVGKAAYLAPNCVLVKYWRYTPGADVCWRGVSGALIYVSGALIYVSGALIDVSVFSVMWLELLVVLGINVPLWSSMWWWCYVSLCGDATSHCVVMLRLTVWWCYVCSSMY